MLRKIGMGLAGHMQGGEFAIRCKIMLNFKSSNEI